MARVNLLELASRSGEFNLFVAAIQAAGLESTFDSNEMLTVLAPTDTAFGGVTDDILRRLIDPGVTDLEHFVNTHLIDGAYFRAALPAAGTVRTRAGTDG